jgi:hypothetical protein
MFSSTAVGVPRFSMTSDRRSTSTRRNILPKVERARKAETTIVSFSLAVEVAMSSPFHLFELYSSGGKEST